ncbi:amidohydrolase family protein [Pseudomonas sp. BN515]|uniref:amidohydrolase family protein n=1 Tax=Pseudomonas sp. BN515 TaxID=2567892 RepID=UPI002457E978|nr:amidohydrolase family protein [Pseudomonas sp. BN515]MDH4870182.1 cytosine deaminase [Pseudomonas sp. BN515]
MTQWITQVRPWGGAAVDIAVVNGRIAALSPPSPRAPESVLLEGNGQIMLPPLVEAHAHFDKTLWGEDWHSHAAGDSLSQRIANERSLLRSIDTPIEERASALIRECITHGSLHFRCHVDVDAQLGSRHLDAMVRVREHFGDLIDMEFVAFPQTGLLRDPGTVDALEHALLMGAENVGGLDPCGIDNDPIAHLTRVFELAATHQRGVDIHLHDEGELGLWQIERIIDFTEHYQLQGRVAISHAFCLGQARPARLSAIAERLAAQRISIISTAPADIEVPPYLELDARGVNLCLGSDGIRDAWSPMGNGDMLERAMFLAFRFNLRRDEEIAACLRAATVNGARALGLEHYGLEPGCHASGVLLPVRNVAEAVVSRTHRRSVISKGRLIARDGQFLAH